MAAKPTRKPANPWDDAVERVASRSGRERGCWVYIPAKTVAHVFSGAVPEQIAYRALAWGKKTVIIRLSSRDDS